MNVQESSELALKFAASASAWWLVLLIPAGAAVVWLLYRRQRQGVPPGAWRVLVALRILLVVGLLFLLFRPSVVQRRVRRYAGRVVVLVDDSRSMGAADNALSETDALRVQRHLADPAASREQSSAYAALAELVLDLELELRRFASFSGTTSRTHDTFWEQAAAYRERLDELASRFATQAAAAPPLADDAARRFANVREEVTRRQAAWQQFFTGAQDPGRKAYDQFAAELQRLRAELLGLQAGFDQRQLAAGNEALRQQVQTIRSRTRLSLVGAELANQAGALKALPGGQTAQTLSLLRPGAPPDYAQPAPGLTDVAGRLAQVVAEDSPFPLAGIVLFSDGREWAGGRRDGADALATVEQELARRQVPVYCAAIGTGHEPYDLSLLQVVTPPFAVRNSPVKVRLRVKTALPEPAPVTIEIRQGTTVAAREEFTVGGRPEEALTMTFRPAETGLFRYAVRVAPATGEAFPVENNQADFALQVRDEPVKVLLLDEKPRWETRFALNILQRLDYLELNSIIVVVQEGGNLPRGTRRGAWPQNLSALELYDLVILGDLPADRLSPAEWQDLARYVTEKGKTVCFLAPARRELIPEAAAALLPLPRRSPTPAPAPEVCEDLLLAPVGETHPLTRGTQGLLVGATAPAARVLPETQVLWQDRATGEALLSCRFVGAGKTAFLTTPQLWKILNPTQLGAHQDLFVQLVSWAVQGRAVAAGDAPQLATDLGAFAATAPLQVWVAGVALATSQVEAVAGDQVVATAPLGTGAALRRAVFANLPPRDVVFRLAGTPTARSAPVILLPEDPELGLLSRHEAFLRGLATATGGEYADFTDCRRFWTQLPVRERVEKSERVWQLWDASLVFGFIFVLLAVEWVWRKLVGLV